MKDSSGITGITEDVMLDMMYHLANTTEIDECIIEPGVINNSKKPVLIQKKIVQRGRLN